MQHDPGAALGLVEVGGRHHQGEAVADQLGEQPPELAPGHRVDAGGRLVEQQHLGRVDQGAGERQLLLHAAGQAVGEAVAEAVEADQLEQLGCDVRASRGRRT